MKLPKLYAFNKKLDIDLSLSENPLGCSPRVFSVLKKDLESIVKYPDPNSSKLISFLAKEFKTSKNQVLLGNGSESLIDLICRTLVKPKEEVILPELTFPLFERAILLGNAKPVFAEMRRDFQIDLETIKNRVTKQTKLIIIVNPNNPTGKTINRQTLLRFIEEIKPIPILVDEANIEFGGKTLAFDIKDNSNLLILRTFSKTFGLAGLRIGFLIGSAKIIDKLRQFIQPFPLNGFAENAAIIALGDRSFIKKTKGFMAQEREFLTNELRKRGFMVFNSDANNFLVQVNTLFPSASSFVKLLNKNNVSVINGKSFRGLGDKFIRVSPRTRKMNSAFIKVIDKILADIV